MIQLRFYLLILLLVSGGAGIAAQEDSCLDALKIGRSNESFIRSVSRGKASYIRPILQDITESGFFRFFEEQSPPFEDAKMGQRINRFLDNQFSQLDGSHLERLQEISLAQSARGGTAPSADSF